MSFVSFLSRILPKAFRDKYRKMIEYSSIKSDADKFIGLAVMLGIMISFFITIFLGNYIDIPPIAMFGSIFLVIELIVYIMVSLSASARAKQIEEALPDALQLMSSNIRAGLTTDKALLMAARPEFGALEEEIRRIGKETMAGKSLVESMEKMALRINSNMLQRTVDLISHSIRSGGKLADLLDSTASDMRDQQIVQKEIQSSVLMYVMFIFIALGLGAPALFSMSAFLVKLLAMNMNLISDEMPTNFDGVAGSAPISMSTIKITPEFILQYSIISMIVSCIFGSMVIGLILKGEEKEGLRYIPMLIILCVGLFKLSTYILETVLGGMMI